MLQPFIEWMLQKAGGCRKSAAARSSIIHKQFNPHETLISNGSQPQLWLLEKY
jgi:hypothetical protein